MVRSMAQQDKRRIKRGGAVAERVSVEEYFPPARDEKFVINATVTDDKYVQVNGLNSHFFSLMNPKPDPQEYGNYDHVIISQVRFYGFVTGNDRFVANGDNNCLLFKLSENGPKEPDEYLFVGGEVVYKFRLLDEIAKLESPLGARGIGTPWLVTKYSTILLNKGQIIPNTSLDEDNYTPYDQEYDRFELVITEVGAELQ
jgi:hypothetical protein